MESKNCTFCGRESHISVAVCEVCQQAFPLPKLIFGTKTECWTRAIGWSLLNLLVPPVFMLFMPFVRSYLVSLVVWAAFIGLVMAIRWFAGWDDGTSYRVGPTRSHKGIGIEILVSIVMTPFNRMLEAWSDLARHYS